MRLLACDAFDHVVEIGGFYYDVLRFRCDLGSVTADDTGDAKRVFIVGDEQRALRQLYFRRRERSELRRRGDVLYADVAFYLIGVENVYRLTDLQKHVVAYIDYRVDAGDAGFRESVFDIRGSLARIVDAADLDGAVSVNRLTHRICIVESGDAYPANIADAISTTSPKFDLKR